MKTLRIKKFFLIFVASVLLSSLTSTILVNAQPTNTSLTIAVSSSPQERTCTIEATLKDENDTPLQNMNIQFWVCDTSLIGTNKTDSAGLASLKLADNPPLFYYPRLSLFEAQKTETYEISAAFEGTTTYAKSSSGDVFVAFVLTDSTSYLVGGGLIAVVVIGVVGYLVLRRRRRTNTMPKTTKQA